MVHIYVHHTGILSLVEEEYIGGEVRYLGNLDPDYISALVIKNFVSKYIGFQNVLRLACKFEDEPWSDGLTYIASDADSEELINCIREERRHTLHIYVEHGVDVLVLVVEDEPPTYGKHYKLLLSCFSTIFYDLRFIIYLLLLNWFLIRFYIFMIL